MIGKLFIVHSADQARRLWPNDETLLRQVRDRILVFGCIIVEVKTCGTPSIYIAANGIEVQARMSVGLA